MKQKRAKVGLAAFFYAALILCCSIFSAGSALAETTAGAETESESEWFLPEKCETLTFTDTYIYPAYEKYSLTKDVTVEKKQKMASDGINFVKCFKAGSPGEDFRTKKSMRIELEELSNITVYAQSGGDSARVLQLADENGNVYKDFAAPGKNDPLSPSPAVNLEAGVYYLYSTNSTVYTYGIHILKGAAKRRAWSDVPAPQIKEVTRGDGGELTVEFTAEFGTDGADNGRVFMFRNGFEAGSAEVTSASPVSFKPDANGDYSFKVILMREGEADKESDEYKVEGYIMPPAVPSITWLNNLGGGSVYADWNNVSADQGCNVYYKEKDADDASYVTVETGNKTGNCTISGLTSGTTYTVKVEAVDSTIGSSQYTRDITAGEPEQEWYADCFGSATKGYVIVNNAETAVKSYDSLYPVSANRVEDVTSGNGTIVMDLRDNENGKIADSEDGIMVYYTRLDPKTENFKLEATFELTNSDIMGNQAGFGIYALDIAGLGTKDAKYMNSVAVGNFKLRDDGVTKYHHSGVRVVTGYETYDPTSTSGSGRNLDNSRVFSTKPAEDKLNPGEKYTYTLEKTDSAFLCSYEGETFEIPGVNKIMAQEDGSIIVALAVGRCNGTITDVKFEKTAGSVTEDGSEEQVEPRVSVYSSDTTGTQDYSFLANANIRGRLSLYRDGEEIGSAEVGEDLVAEIAVDLWNPGEENDMTYRFEPDASEANLTSYDPIEGSWSVKWRIRGADQQVFYTAPEAAVNGLGTREEPADLQTLLNSAMPGQTIVMLDGEYAPSEQYLIPRNVSGEEGKRILLMAENPGSVKVTGQKMDSASLLHIVGNYWHVYGIEFCDGKNKGVSVSGNNNVVEMCTMHDVGNSGLQISRYAGEPNVQEMWPSNNLIKNCEAYNCCDPARNDADGFAAKLTCGEGNVFYGCISHHNIDDGWDLYAKSTTGPIGAVTIENCVAYSNGFLLGDDPSDSSVAFGEGNGFKLGGENMYGAHKLINSVSFHNYAKGITSNSGPDCQVINCTAYNNSLKGGSYNLSLYTKQSNEKAWVVNGVISLATNGTTEAELGKANGVIYSLRSSTNYLFDGEKSENNQGVVATEDWFESTDVSIVPTRNSDGTINMNGLLVLKDNAPSDSGARINTSSEAVSAQPAVTGKEAERLVENEVTGAFTDEMLTDAVKKAAGVETAAELKEYFRKEITENENAQAILMSVDEENITFYDVQVKISYDGGNTWIIADEETFPTAGVDLLFAYPEGTNSEDYEFVVAHLITTSVNGQEAGGLEFLAPEKTADGLKVHVRSASPFAIGWNALEEEAPEAEDAAEEGETANPNTVENSGDSAAAAPSSGAILSPATAENGSFRILMAILLIVSGIGMALTFPACRRG
ncbi:MAG: hypothetical protein K6E30_09300 [Lachnospiraceae bacterium]|nr:hypothetical protein [Lachnospiraceae bacterium]